MATKLEMQILAQDKASSVFKSVSTNAGNMGSALGGVGKMGLDAGVKVAKGLAMIGVAAGAAAAGIVLLSAKIGKDFEYSVKSMGAVAGATTSELKLLEEQARNIGSTTAFSAKEASDAMYNLASAGLSVTDILGSAESAVILAGAAVGSMDSATSLMASTMKIYNIEAGKAAHITDVLTMTTHKAMTTMEGLQIALGYVSPVASAFGWSLEEAASATKVFLDMGLDASTAGTTLRQTISTLAKDSSKLRKELKGLGLAYEDLNPATHSFDEILNTLSKTTFNANTAMLMFGRTGGAVATAVDQYKKGLIDVDGFTKQLTNSTGYAETAYNDMMDSVEGQYQILKSTLQELMLTVFDSYSTHLKDLLTAASDFVTNLTSVYGEISPVVNALGAYLKQFAIGALSQFKVFSDGFDLTREQTKKTVFGIIKGFQKGLIILTGILQSITSTVQLLVITPLNALAGAVAVLLSAVLNNIKFTLDSIASAANFIAPVSDAAGGIAEKLWKAGDAIAALQGGVTGFALGRFEAVGSGIEAALTRDWVGTINDAFGEIDPYIIADGIDDAFNVSDALEREAARIQAIKAEFSGFETGGESDEVIKKKTIIDDTIPGGIDSDKKDSKKSGGGKEAQNEIAQAKKTAESIAEQRRRARLTDLERMKEDQEREVGMAYETAQQRYEVEQYWSEQIRTEEAKAQEDRIAKQQAFADQLSGTMTTAFSSMLQGQMTFAEAGKQILADSVANALQEHLREAIAGTWKNAAVFGFGDPVKMALAMAAGTAGVALLQSTITGLASGGIATGPTLAMIGEGGESEMILPLSKAKSMGFGGDGGGLTVVINQNGPILGTTMQAKKTARVQARHIEKQLVRRGIL